MPSDTGKRQDKAKGPTHRSPEAGLVQQMQDEVDRWASRFGLSSPSNWLAQAAGTIMDWKPAIDAFQRGNEFVIRADVPGMNRTDLSVEVGDDAITIRGERKHEAEEDREGVFWSERSYGTFCRVVPIPPGAIGESAKATFTNGVLEVVMPAPSQESRRGRKIDISGGRDEKKGAYRSSNEGVTGTSGTCGASLGSAAAGSMGPAAVGSGRFSGDAAGGRDARTASRRRNSLSTRLGVLSRGFQPRRNTVISTGLRPKASASWQLHIYRSRMRPCTRGPVSMMV